MKLTGQINNANIEELLQKAQRELERVGVEEDDRLRFRLSAEELLLAAREALGEAAVFRLELRKESGREIAELSIPGQEMEHPEESPILSHLLEGWEAAPELRYVAGENRVRYCLPLPGGMKENLRFLLDAVGPERILVRVPLIPDYNSPEDQRRSAEALRAMGVTRLDCFSYVKRED